MKFWKIESLNLSNPTVFNSAAVGGDFVYIF